MTLINSVLEINLHDAYLYRSKGFGFIEFKKSHMIDDSQKARPHKIDGKTVETKRAMPREVHFVAVKLVYPCDHVIHRMSDIVVCCCHYQ